MCRSRLAFSGIATRSRQKTNENAAHQQTQGSEQCSEAEPGGRTEESLAGEMAGLPTRTLELIVSRRPCFPPDVDIFPISRDFRKGSI